VTRVLLAAVVAVLLCMATAAPASAEVCPPYEGVQFPEIHSAADPEDYCWEVQLAEEQELRQIDEQHVGVYYSEEGQLAFTIAAQPAHDVEGASVPTSIAVTGASDITVTVHHREGNPAAGGAPFDYPISEGVGWEGGFQTVPVTMPPGEPPPAPATASCEVPNLVGTRLRAARKKLRRAHCRLGSVDGKRSRSSRVIKQFRKPGASLPAGAKVGVKLAGRSRRRAPVLLAQARAPEREETDGQHRARPVEGEEDGDEARQAG
jgi:hypothetical protein